MFKVKGFAFIDDDARLGNTSELFYKKKIVPGIYWRLSQKYISLIWKIWSYNNNSYESNDFFTVTVNILLNYMMIMDLPWKEGRGKLTEIYKY